MLGSYYRSDATGFGVIELQTADGDAFRCSGPLADVVEGQWVRVVGALRDHPTYGPTFEALFYEQVAPATLDGLRTFLCSDRFPGVGAKTVDRLITAFGASTGWVIERDPDRMVREAGVRPALARTLHGQWRKGQALADLVRLVEPVGWPFDVTRAVFAHFGAAAVDVARDDPYTLLAVDRCRFAHADALALHLGGDPLETRRLAAGARAAHAAARARDGHQYLTRPQLAREAAALLHVDLLAAGAGIDAAVSAGALAVDSVAPEPDVEPVEALYTTEGLVTERQLARDLARLATAPRSRLRSHATRIAPGAGLTGGQRDAVLEVFRSPVSVLTGGPGTGKTRTVDEVVRAAEAAGLEVALCAPTGRAAKRLEELVGRSASTVHRLLEARSSAGGFTFRYGGAGDHVERLPSDLVVCDEVSMCDTWLAMHLVSAVDDGTHLLLVGDADQLPSVGPGDVLRDLLRSGVVATTTLTEVHRQAAGSRVITLAHEVNRGEVVPPRGIDGDVFMAEEIGPRIVARVVEAVANRIPGYFGVEPVDVQVVAPIYRGVAGVDALNRALKAALNPSTGASVAGFQVGDRVMQTRNDIELDVSNGDVGTVVDLQPGTRARLRVRFPRGEVSYDADSARDLTAAWAITVHKAQGGEWPVIVFVCDRSHRGMLWRNLAYTAITRAQRALVIVGQAQTLVAAARADRPRNRQTLLAARLRAALAAADREDDE